MMLLMNLVVDAGQHEELALRAAIVDVVAGLRTPDELDDFITDRFWDSPEWPSLARDALHILAEPDTDITEELRALLSDTAQSDVRTGSSSQAVRVVSSVHVMPPASGRLMVAEARWDHEGRPIGMELASTSDC